jgi:hypothetical protein
MSVFKRLGNVARGKMKELGRTLDNLPGDEPEPIDPDTPPPRRPATTDDKREMLERLRADGLLTDEEFAEKIAALEQPSVRTPKKRHL